MQHVTKDGSSCICMKCEKASLWCDTRDMKVAPVSVTWMSGMMVLSMSPSSGVGNFQTHEWPSKVRYKWEFEF